MIESENPLPPENPNNSNNDIINNSLPPVSNNNTQIRAIPQRVESNQNQNIINDNQNNPDNQDEQYCFTVTCKAITPKKSWRERLNVFQW